jgi:hypothetical protein
MSLSNEEIYELFRNVATICKKWRGIRHYIGKTEDLKTKIDIFISTDREFDVISEFEYLIAKKVVSEFGAGFSFETPFHHFVYTIVEGDPIFDSLVHKKSNINIVGDRISYLLQLKDAYQNSVSELVNLAVEMGMGRR